MLRSLALLAGLTLCGAPAASQAKLLFAQNGNGTDPIRRANLDGSQVEELITGLGGPQDVAVDAATGQLYWTDGGRVQRANLDGSGVQTVVATSGILRALAVDSAAGHVYFGDLIAQKIQRANLDGSGVQDIVLGVQTPERMELDLGAGKLYWCDLNGGALRRANLDGSGVELVHGFQCLALALDPAAGHLYLTAGNEVRRSNLDGSGLVSLLSSSGSLRGLDVDPAGGKLYFTSSLDDAVRRANLDGSGVEDLITSGLDTPLGLALDLGACPSGPASALSYGCGLNPAGSLPVLSGAPRIGTTLSLGVDNPLGTQAAGALGFLALQSSPDPNFPCGTQLPGWGMSGPGANGELLVGLAPAPVLVAGGSWAPGSPVPFALPIPADCGLVGQRFYAQGALFDFSAVLTGVGLGLTEGRELIIGS